MSMMTRTKRQSLVDIINVRLWDPENVSFKVKIGESRNQAKMNASLGCLLVHKTTGEFRYFHSSSNNATDL